MVFILLVILLSTDRWAEKDVNPALFSRELMRNSSKFLNDEEVYLYLTKHHYHKISLLSIYHLLYTIFL